MKHYLPAFFLIVILPVTGLEAKESSEKEPTQKFILKIDNTSHEVSINTNHKIVVSGKPHKVRIEVSPTRNFNKAGLNFDFDSKRHFSYEELSPVVDHWSLDGNNTVIIIQNYKVKVENSEILDSFKEEYRKMKAKTKSTKTKLNYDGKNVSGQRLLINMGDIKLEQQIFFFNKKGETRVMILQDAPNEDNSNTKEFVTMRKLVQKTLSVD
jgi:hypothetical protein